MADFSRLRTCEISIRSIILGANQRECGGVESIASLASGFSRKGRHMHQLIRNAFIAGLLFLTPAATLAQQTPDLRPMVQTTGEGLVEAVPDRAWINITAESR